MWNALVNAGFMLQFKNRMYRREVDLYLTGFSSIEYLQLNTRHCVLGIVDATISFSDSFPLMGRAMDLPIQ
jgi:hypothetical protein